MRWVGMGLELLNLGGSMINCIGVIAAAIFNYRFRYRLPIDYIQITVLLGFYGCWFLCSWGAFVAFVGGGCLKLN